MLSDVLQDPQTAMSTSPDDSAFHRSHGVSLFDFYDSVSNLDGSGTAYYDLSRVILCSGSRGEIQRCKILFYFTTQRKKNE